MKAYDKGFQAGKEGVRRPYRVYETQKAEDAFRAGYAAGVSSANPGKRIVECTRDGTVMAVDDINDCTCPQCGRRYINGESDRKLKVVM